MRVLERIIVFCKPDLKIPPAWRSSWIQNDNLAFINTAIIGLWSISLGHILHHFLVDEPLKLSPERLWTSYRVGMSVYSVGTALVLSHIKFKFGPLLVRLPFLIWGAVQSYLQAETMQWSDKVPYGFSVLVPCVISIVARLSPLASGFYLIALFAVGMQFWNPAKDNNMIYSAAVVGLVIVSVFRSRMVNEVDLFITTQKERDAQSKLIASQIELNDQIKAFLPKIIYQRFQALVQNNGLTSLQAMDEVMRVRVAPVACLYSDIRGYTQMSKQSTEFLVDSVIPNMKVCTDIVESNNGVPRVIADLIFAYFDEQPEVSILRSVKSAISIYLANVQYPDIKRFIIISFGEARVGNVGGSGNSREITAMGSVANIVNRIDLLTKEATFKSKISTDLLLLTERATEKLLQQFPLIKFEYIYLNSIGLKIKDFPEETRVGTIRMNRELLDFTTLEIDRQTRKFLEVKSMQNFERLRL